MLGLIERVEQAEDIQYYWNHLLDKYHRQKLSDEKEDIVNSLFRQAGCETQCTTCLCIMDTALEPIRCTECGGDTTSPYYC